MEIKTEAASAGLGLVVHAAVAAAVVDDDYFLAAVVVEAGIGQFPLFHLFL